MVSLNDSTIHALEDIQVASLNSYEHTYQCIDEPTGATYSELHIYSNELPESDGDDDYDDTMHIPHPRESSDNVSDASSCSSAQNFEPNTNNLGLTCMNM